MSVIPEVAVEEQVDPAILKIREDRELAEAVRDYLEEVKRFEDARGEHDARMQALRLLTDKKKGTTLVISGGYGSLRGKNFLLAINSDGSFNLNPVKVI